MVGPPQAPPAAGNAKLRFGWEYEGKNEVDIVKKPKRKAAKVQGQLIHRVALAGLDPDPRNANRGTARGRQALGLSIKEYGFGRSILLDKKGKVIAGNKALEVALATGAREAIIIPSDGKSLIAVQRTDLDLERDPRARELAIADNRVAELDLDWDPATLEALSREINLTKFWTAEELEGLLARTPEGKIEEPEAPAPVLHVCPKCGHKFR